MSLQRGVLVLEKEEDDGFQEEAIVVSMSTHQDFVFNAVVCYEGFIENLNKLSWALSFGAIGTAL